MNNNLPKFRTKLFFWIIIGSISTFFAEVIAGSFLFPFIPFVDAWGILILIPFYTFHMLIFSYLIYNYGSPKLYTLFFAGAMFGMYEAYATGVLWTGWNGSLMISFFGLGIIETIILALFWHPLVSFTIPLIICDSFLTKQKLIDTKRFTSKKVLILIAILFGFIQSFNMPSPIISLVAGVANIPFIALLVYLWKRKKDKYSMKELLPNKLQFVIIFILLILLYILIRLVSAYKMPDITAQIVVWFIYVILGYIFYKALKKSKNVITPQEDVIFSWKTFALLAVIFVFSSMIFTIIFTPIRNIMWIILLLIYITAGLTSLIYFTYHVFKS